MLSVYVRSPSSVLAHSDCARRTTTTMGSRLSSLPLSVWSKGMSLIPWLGRADLRCCGALIRLGNVHHDLRLGADLISCADDSSAWSGDWSLDKSLVNLASYLTSLFGYHSSMPLTIESRP